MKATTLLETQHKQVASLIEQLEKPGGERRHLVDQLATSIAAHMIIEEEIFYPATMNLQRELIRQGAEDHESELPIVMRLREAGIDKATFAARLQVLKCLLQAHMAKEEGILFPTVKREVKPAKNRSLGRQMKKRFDQIARSGADKAIKLRVSRSEQMSASPESASPEPEREEREERESAAPKAGKSGKASKASKSASQKKAEKKAKAKESSKGASRRKAREEREASAVKPNATA